MISLTVHRVLFHLEEGSTFRGKLVMDNIANLVDDLGEKNVQIELVVNSAGIKLFQRETSPVSSEVESLLQRGVQVAMCRNSLRYYKFNERLFLDNVIFVDSCVGELVRKQSEGWSYIKP